ncbi:tRNA-(MS[2]IO[6]A)-hydroxylase (MiaE)-like [Actinomyces denticolens]|uniref:tRNA-(MS[2]IO[6]A)-hydroxylase (MiaE)-like n=1 Tax=Actinomyces denticolens TaxID=52767 RepID=A0ABY1I2Q5_9ACTO|nr:ferritin-like fold-containing protein [Actinomyces denticolens]SHI41006.1 tRNA-(MS[2]IO[6]A)-hydroxylase (MiaE)-like [Actinomyces denticolens]
MSASVLDPVPASTPLRTAPSAPDGFMSAVLGVVGYSCSVACTRYAKDADKAPAMPARIELLRMSAAKVSAFDAIIRIGADEGVDVPAAAERFLGSLGDVDDRLRPHDWAERLVKTYLSFGLLVDFGMALTDSLPPRVRNAVLEALSEDRFGSFAAAELMADLGGDPQLVARLGLWGRRVAGEEIGAIQLMLARFPELAGGEQGAARLSAVLSSGTTSRMKGLGLRV